MFVKIRIYITVYNIYLPIIDVLIHNLLFRFSNEILQTVKVIDIFLDIDFESIL